MKTRLFLFLFTLVLMASCGGGGTEKPEPTTRKDVAEAPVDNKAAGEKIFRTYCITCHGIDGKLGLNGAKDLALSEITMEERILQITKGKGLMTPFEGILTEEQIKQVAEYAASFKQQ